MRNTTQRLSAHPVYLKFYSWSKLITITGGAQVIVQAATLFCGILVIRLLPTEEYALYTIANTMLGTMSLLADGGISTGVLSFGGKSWQDPEQLGMILATGLQMRRKFALGSLLVAIPVLVYLLLHHKTSWLNALLIAASLIPSFLAALSDSLLEIVPKLHQDIKPLQKNQISVGVLRLALTAALLFIFPWAFIAVFASGLSRMYGNIKLKKIAGKFVTKKAADKQKEKDILKVVKRVLPNVFYYCFASQISIWLISIFGSTTSLAQVGALSRLGIVTAVFSTIAGTLVIPRFARFTGDKKMIITRYIQIVFLLFLLCIAIVGITSIFPQQFLYILGKKYDNLENELILSMIVSCLGFLIGVLHNLSMARGYVLSPVINIGVHIISQIILIASLNLSTTRNIFIFSIFDTSIIVVMTIANFFYYVYKTEPLKFA